MAKNVENFKGYEYFKALYMQGQVSVYSQKLKNGKYGVLLTIQTGSGIIWIVQGSVLLLQ